MDGWRQNEDNSNPVLKLQWRISSLCIIEPPHTHAHRLCQRWMSHQRWNTSRIMSHSLHLPHTYMDRLRKIVVPRPLRGLSRVSLIHSHRCFENYHRVLRYSRVRTFNCSNDAATLSRKMFHYGILCIMEHNSPASLAIWNVINRRLVVWRLTV